MATTSIVSETTNAGTTGGVAGAGGVGAGALLISLTPLSSEALPQLLAKLAVAFPSRNVLVATPDPAPGQSPAPTLQIVTYTPSAPAAGGWLLCAADFLNTYKLAQEHKSSACLLLGAESQSLSPDALRGLAEAVASADLVMPRYALGSRDGLVNSAILYPVTRALFAARPRYPLAIDLAFSCRMAERLAATAQRYTAAGQNAGLVWPVAEAASAGMTIAEVPAGPRALPPPDAADLNTLLAQVAGSLFADIEAKASFWQRARSAYSARNPAAAVRAARPAVADRQGPPDVQPMLDSFRLAYTNLHELWSLVLPPNSLLGLKKLSLMPPTAFRMDDRLWARIVYDFILAYRLRTINRGHLLGALTPLYLAWVASHLMLTGGTRGEDAEPEALAGKGRVVGAEEHIEALAVAFEADKPYLVSRWRWPDRFNP